MKNFFLKRVFTTFEFTVISFSMVIATNASNDIFYICMAYLAIAVPLMVVNHVIKNKLKD